MPAKTTNPSPAPDLRERLTEALSPFSPHEGAIELMVDAALAVVPPALAEAWAAERAEIEHRINLIFRDRPHTEAPLLAEIQRALRDPT